MDVHTSPAALPELQAFLGAFQVRFRRPEGRAALERYTTGLLTELPTKNGDTIAQAMPGTSAQRLQEFLTRLFRISRARVEGACAGYTDIRHLSCNPEFGVALSCYSRLLFLYRGAR
jgi:hypothetical protein